MIELIKKIENSKSIDINKEVRKKDFTDEEVLILSTYIVKNNISLTRESEDVKDYDSEISDELKDYLKSIRKEEHLENIEDSRYTKCLNIGIIEAIKNIKQGYSITELINDSYLYVAQFITNYYDKLSNTYSEENLLEILRIYVLINLLICQKNITKDEFSEKMAILLYLDIKEELGSGKDIEEVLESKEIDEDYYNTLCSTYKDISIDDLEDVKEYAQNIQDEYSSSYQTFMLTYLEENILISYLGLEGKKYTEKEIETRFNINFKEHFITILRKLSENI